MYKYDCRKIGEIPSIGANDRDVGGGYRREYIDQSFVKSISLSKNLVFSDKKV